MKKKSFRQILQPHRFDEKKMVIVEFDRLVEDYKKNRSFF